MLSMNVSFGVYITETRKSVPNVPKAFTVSSISYIQPSTAIDASTLELNQRRN